MRCYRKILHISYKDHVTNEEVRAKIQQAIGPHEDLLTIVKRRKLQWYDHVSRSWGLAKTILQGTLKGGRRQGGQRKKWEDNIRDWTGLEFGKFQRAVENREKWRKLVAKSSVVPQRPSRLGIDDDDDELAILPLQYRVWRERGWSVSAPFLQIFSQNAHGTCNLPMFGSERPVDTARANGPVCNMAWSNWYNQ